MRERGETPVPTSIGVRHALLPPSGDVNSAPCGAELFFLPFHPHLTLRAKVGGPQRVGPTSGFGLSAGFESLVAERGIVRHN